MATAQAKMADERTWVEEVKEVQSGRLSGFALGEVVCPRMYGVLYSASRGESVVLPDSRLAL